MREQPHLDYESAGWSQGYRLIAGIDEAGRGAWAGPVVAAAVILPLDEAAFHLLADVRDSKLMTPRQRDRCFPLICGCALAYGVGFAHARVVDADGIVPATRAAMRQAITHLSAQPDYLLIDAVTLQGVSVPQKAIIKGDRQSLSIAAASVLAKVTRDRYMASIERISPGYGHDRHKGYGTPQHREALADLGPSIDHRRSFRPIRMMVQQHD